MRAALMGLILVACDARGADTTPTGPPACPTWGEPEQVGTVAQAGITESSGLVASRRHADALWVHNDSGDGPHLFAIGTDGAARGVFRLSGATSVDWEDLAAAPGPDGEPSLFVGDIGDNTEIRDGIDVWRLREPTALSGTAAAPTQVSAARLALTYPDGPHNAEALMVEPDGSLIIVTKARDGATGVYRAAAPVGPRTELTRVASLDIGSPPMDGDKLVTAGDLSTDGSLLLLRTYLRTWVWTRAPEESVADALGRPPCRAPTPPEPQGEAVGLSRDGQRYWSVSEGDAQPVWRATINP